MFSAFPCAMSEMMEGSADDCEVDYTLVYYDG